MRTVCSLLLVSPAAACIASPPMQRAPSRHAVLWDLDGTLCDSFRLSFDATTAVLAERGHAPASEADYHACTRYATPERMARHVGLLPGDASFERVGAELGTAFDALYISQVSAQTAPLFQGAAEVCRRLGGAGVPQALLTNAAVEYAEAVLAAHGLRHLFAVVHGADSVPRAKPAPDGLLQCVEELRGLGLLAQEAEACAGVYVGDSPSDGEAARAARLASVGVCWGSHSASSLRTCGQFDLLCAAEGELQSALLARPDALPATAAAFLLDRDGVLNEDVGHPGVLQPDKLRLLPGAARALSLLRRRGHPTALVTNQKAVGSGATTEANVAACHERLRDLLLEEEADAELGPIFAALGDGRGPAPKPSPALLEQALAALRCKANHALMVGDARTDAQAAAACSVRFALVTSSAHGEEAAAQLVQLPADAEGAPLLALASGAPVGGGVHAGVLEAVRAELARVDRAAAEACLQRLAGHVDVALGEPMGH